MEITISEYQAWIGKFIVNHDVREINFQNDVIKRLLERLFPKYDIVYVDDKGPDSKMHDYYAYSGEYVDENGKIKPTTPDLLVCKNWDWYNVDNDHIQYIATIEVKSPCGDEAIYKKDYVDYPEKWKRKIETHLKASKIDKVVFTDSVKWDFFKNDDSNYESIELVERIKKGRGYTYKWRDDVEIQFEKLINKLLDFL